MTENDPIAMETDGNPEENRNETRTPRGIRFSDSEWERVKRAAAKQDIPAAEFVRNAALGLAEGKTDGDSVALTHGHVALIERTFRCAYILSTLKRDEMVREGRCDEMDDMVKAARRVQASLLSSDPSQPITYDEIS